MSLKSEICFMCVLLFLAYSSTSFSSSVFNFHNIFTSFSSLFLHFFCSSLLSSSSSFESFLSLGSWSRSLSMFSILLSLWIWMLIRKLRWTRLVHVTKESRRKWCWLILLWATCYSGREKIEKWAKNIRIRWYFP